MIELFPVVPEETNTQRFVRSHPPTWSRQTLAEQFPWLKSVSIDLDFLDSSGMATVAWVKFKPSVEKATLQTCFAMHGYVLNEFDFDLEQILGQAFATNQRIIREAGPAT